MQITGTRLTALEEKRGAANTQTVVIWAADESEADAFRRAEAAGAKWDRPVVVIKRFCQTVAEITGAQIGEVRARQLQSIGLGGVRKPLDA